MGPGGSPAGSVRAWSWSAQSSSSTGAAGSSPPPSDGLVCPNGDWPDRKSTRLNSSHVAISYAVFCLKKKKIRRHPKRGEHEVREGHNGSYTLDTSGGLAGRLVL